MKHARNHFVRCQTQMVATTTSPYLSMGMVDLEPCVSRGRNQWGDIPTTRTKKQLRWFKRTTTLLRQHRIVYIVSCSGRDWDAYPEKTSRDYNNNNFDKWPFSSEDTNDQFNEKILLVKTLNFIGHLTLISEMVMPQLIVLVAITNST